MKRRVAIVGVGGTIAMTDQGAGLRPAIGAAQLASGLASGSDVEFEVVEFRAVPSASLSWSDLFALADTVTDLSNRGLDGAVIMQGTDTLEETSFAFELLYAGTMPVAFTGAMRAPSQAGTDGPGNIAASVSAVLASEGEQGILVVLNGEVHAARYVRKSHTTALNAFASGDHGILGRLHEGVLRWQHVSQPRLARRPPRGGAAIAKVALIRFAFDQPTDLIEMLPQLGYRGCVIEAMGAGHVPAASVAPLAALAKAMPVVLSTRVESGRICERTYAYPGSETELLAAGLLSAGPLAALKARMLLTLCLMSDAAGAKAAFTETVAML